MTTTRDRPAAERVRVRRFDADRTDQLIELEAALESKLTERQLLWIDIAGGLSSDEARAIAERFVLDARTRRALESDDEAQPHLALSGAHFHLRVVAEPGDTKAKGTKWLDVIAGRNVVISQHAEPIDYLVNLDDRIEADTTLGLLDSASFVAALLDSTISSYFDAVDAIEDEVDRLDARSLTDDGRGQLLADLVAVRRRIARLRRVLAPHREVFALLAAADLTNVVESPSGGAGFNAVARRFESALAAVEGSRDVLLGSFDIHMTRTAQRTNDIVKVLALATVLLLPGSLVAALLGMNVVVPLDKDDPLSFWLVVAGVGAFIVILLAVARIRRWL